MGLKSYSRDLILTNISNEELQVLSIKVAKSLNWEIKYISAFGVIFTNPLVRRSKLSNITLNFTDEMPELTAESINGGFYDFGRNKELIDSFVLELNELLGNLDREELAKEYELLKPNFPDEKEDILNPSHISHQLNEMSFMEFLIPTKTYFVTPIIIYLNFLAFIVMLGFGVSPINPTAEQIIQWGGNIRHLTLSGEYWRLLSACFIHIGAVHFLLNIYSLVFVGFMVEKRIGPMKYALAYLSTGILASLASVYWNETIVSAGASGAIFGIYGLYLILLSSNIMPKDVRKTFLSSIVIFVLYNLLNGFAKEGIDNAAHIGGLISGVLIGLFYLPILRENHKPILKLLIPSTVLVLTIGLSIVGLKSISNDVSIYQSKIQKFFEQESKALRFYTFNEYTPRDTILNEIKNISTPLWDSNVDILNSCTYLDLNNDTKLTIVKLKKYCTIRLELNDLIYKAISENTDIYQDAIEEKSKNIDEIIQELSITE